MAKNNEVNVENKMVAENFDDVIKKVEAFSGQYVNTLDTVVILDGVAQPVNAKTLITKAIESPAGKVKGTNKSYHQAVIEALQKELTDSTAKQRLSALLLMAMGESLASPNYLTIVKGKNTVMTYDTVDALRTDLTSVEKGKQGRKSGEKVTINADSI